MGGGREVHEGGREGGCVRGCMRVCYMYVSTTSNLAHLCYMAVVCVCVC